MANNSGSDAKPDLRLVAAEAEVYDLMRPPETTAERVKRLQLEAHALARVAAVSPGLSDLNSSAGRSAPGL